MAKDFRVTLAEQMNDPQFKAEWDALEPEFQMIRAMLDDRAETGLTQRQLAELTDIAQADISRLENGSADPSLHTLRRLADGLGKTIHLEITPSGR